MMDKNSKRGISLYLAIIVMVVLLTIIIGVSSILIKQLKTIRGMENSVVAFYAADAGIETMLMDFFDGDLTDVQETYTLPFSNGATGEVEVVCCGAGANCIWGAGACPLPVADPDCDSAYYYCIKSVGVFNGVRRAVLVEL